MSRHEEIKKLWRLQKNGTDIVEEESTKPTFSPKIWVVSVGEGWKEELSACEENDGWSVPSRSRKNDLILFYHNQPESSIRDIFRITGEVRKELAGEWTAHRCDFFAPIERIARIRSPITFRKMKTDAALSSSQMIRMKMNGRFEVTGYWDNLYEMIIQKNPGLKEKLSPYSP